MKKGSLGPAFHTYLEYLEGVEVMMDMADHGKLPAKTQKYSLNQAMFQTSQKDFEALMMDVVPVDAFLAGVVRSSAKFKISCDTIEQLIVRYKDEINYLLRETPLMLPFQWNTVILDGVGDATVIIVAQEQEAPEDGYPELGIDGGEKFACLNFCFYRPFGTLDLNDKRKPEYKLSHIPLEVHFALGDTEPNTKIVQAGAGKVHMTPEGDRTMMFVWNSFLIWLVQFELQGVLRSRTKGIKPMKQLIRRHKKRKKFEHPQFEHTVIQMEIDAPAEGQAGYSILQSKKRLHQVRGFWRTYRKSGKRVWVKGHWRGDEKLGVIRRDVELVTHEEEEHG